MAVANGTENREDKGEYKAIEVIKRLGGHVERDEESAGKPIITVNMSKTKASSSDLCVLRALAHIRTLNLSSTEVSGEGLQELAGLKMLTRVCLHKTKVTNDGL